MMKRLARTVASNRLQVAGGENSPRIHRQPATAGRELLLALVLTLTPTAAFAQCSGGSCARPMRMAAPSYSYAAPAYSHAPRPVVVSEVAPPAYSYSPPPFAVAEARPTCEIGPAPSAWTVHRGPFTVDSIPRPTVHAPRSTVHAASPRCRACGR